MTPDTPQTLLRKIAEFANGDDSAEWARFVELYEPVIRHYIAAHGGVADSEVDDIVQDIFVRLVDVLRSGPLDEDSAGDGSMDAATIVDIRLRAARHAAAIEHVLSRTILDKKTVAAYRAYVLEGRPAEEVAAAHKMKINALRQIKHRIGLMIAAVESAYGD